MHSSTPTDRATPDEKRPAPRPSALRQAGTGMLHAMRLLAVVFALLAGAIGVWAYSTARELAAAGSRATDDFGRLYVGLLGGAGSVVYTIVALVAFPLCLAAIAWAYAMHVRLRAANRGQS